MEGLCGMAVLTTNHRENIDQAFIRVICQIPDFPVPGASQRKPFWHRYLLMKQEIANQMIWVTRQFRSGKGGAVSLNACY